MKNLRKTIKFDPEKDERRFPFTRDQISRIESFYPDFEASVEKHDPSYAGKNAKVTEWKKKKAKYLLKEPLFESLSTEKVTLDQWEDAIRRFYMNHFNYKMKKSKKIKGSSATKESTNKNTLLIFTGDISARQYFIHENHADIHELYTKICREMGKPGGAAKQQACKILWDQADHREWEEKVASMLKDTAANQAEFEDVVTESFENLLTSGILGSCALSLSYGFRNEKDEIVAGKINIAYDDNISELWGTDFESDIDSVARWADYASSILPRKRLVLATEFQRKEDGTVLFPAINLMETPPLHITTMIRDYFTAMWDHAHGAISIPWDDIARSPDTYYDTSAALAVYLAGQKFVFYPKEKTRHSHNKVGNVSVGPSASGTLDAAIDVDAASDNAEKQADDRAGSGKEVDDHDEHEEEEEPSPRRPTTAQKHPRIASESPSPPPSVVAAPSFHPALGTAALDEGDKPEFSADSAEPAVSLPSPAPKGKKGKKTKGKKRAIEAEPESVVPPTEEPAGRPRRRDVKPPAMCPQLVSDPSKPPPPKKRLAERHAYVPDKAPAVEPAEPVKKRAKKT